MPTAISANGVSQVNSFDRWEAITILFDDGSQQVLRDVAATTRQIFQLTKRPEQYAEILGVSGGEEI